MDFFLWCLSSPWAFVINLYVVNVAKAEVIWSCLSKDKGHSSWGEKNPATDLGPAEEGTDHLLGHTEKAVQTMQRKNERGVVRTV